MELFVLKIRISGTTPPFPHMPSWNAQGSLYLILHNCTWINILKDRLMSRQATIMTKHYIMILIYITHFMAKKLFCM